MKKLAIAILLSFMAGGIVISSVNIWYFEYRTGMPLLDLFSIKSKCETSTLGHCWLVYYFVPDKAIRPLEFEEPDRVTL